MYDNILKPSTGFQTSINIAYDINNMDKIGAFIPTQSAIEVIEDVLLSTTDSSTERARIFIGAYGRGKSHIVLVLLALLRLKDKKTFLKLLAKIKDINPSLYEFACEYINSNKKILPIVISGSSASLTQSFLNALQQTLIKEGLEDLMPDTHFIAAVNTIHVWKKEYKETYERFCDAINIPAEEFVALLKEFDVKSYEMFRELYPKLTSGSEFNPFLGFDIVEIYEQVVAKLNERGYAGAYVIYDEFSKYLESSIGSATISDVKLLQDFAEKCNRSGNKQLHLMLICHKDISNYIDDNLPKEKVDGWRGVSGRFKHVHLHNNFSQMYEIIGAVINKNDIAWNNYLKKNSNFFRDIEERINITPNVELGDNSVRKSLIIDCFPLHPISTFILPRLSEKIAQNERTLFTFLSSEQKYTLAAFLKEKATSAFELLTPDWLYDYFEPLLRKEPYTSEIHKLYKTTEYVLRKVDDRSLEAKIIKSISLIYFIAQFEKLPPTYDVIVSVFKSEKYGTDDISNALSNLQNRDCIVYLRRSNNYLKIKESSGIDIHQEIKKEIGQLKSSVKVKDILNDTLFDNYLYPTQYNDENEIIRYFNFSFIESDEFFGVSNWKELCGKDNADGRVFALLPKSQKELQTIRKTIENDIEMSDQIVFILPQKYRGIDEIVYEYAAVKKLRSLAGEDEILEDEYDVYIEDLDEVLTDFIYAYIRPEGNKSGYYFKNESQRIVRKTQLSALLSRACTQLYPHYPVINNESINKNVLPTVALNSRTKLVQALLSDDYSVNFGLTGTGQDVSMMRSTLVRTGIMQDVDTLPDIVQEPADANIRYMMNAIWKFFSSANKSGGVSFSILYDILRKPGRKGIGLKKGVIPIFLAVALHKFKKDVVIVNNGQERKVSADLLNSINESPADFTITLEEWNDEKRQYMKSLNELFKDFINDKEKSFNSFSYIVLAMNRWYMSLPKYSKEAVNTFNNEGEFDPITRESIKFVNSLKLGNNNAREYLFEELVKIYGYKEFDMGIVEKIAATKRIYDSTLSNLKQKLANDIKTVFYSNHINNSISSVIKDWLDKLSAKTMNHLFENNENRILNVMIAVGNDEPAFVENLAKIVTSLRIEDWDDKMIEAFSNELKTFKVKVEEYNRSKNKIESAEQYTISFIDAGGEAKTKNFSKTKYSPRTKLLLNAISSAIDEMGESISEQEKRQVLIDLLVKMC